MAFPPYLTTIFFPLNELSDDAIVIVLSANPSLAASDGSCRLLLTGWRACGDTNALRCCERGQKG